ncbi:ricin B lectin domain-containing protein [Amylocarpus encephaloides]|uniref:Ricin B lectin domain-containing protein n=1 Tax=Amylocarpus encephaloides TaxID=45428 RepID=A0A9P7YCX0_9HELO|nr:ricin B lectin domain-containing protein [Amylocarpus encephaloides]
MLSSSFLVLALAAAGLAQVMPEGYRKVIMTSMVDKKFVIVAKAPVKAGTTLIVQTRNDKPEQHWYLKDGSSTIQLADTTLCLDGGPKANWRDMGSIYVKDCSETEVAQKWNVMADGRIALEASNSKECIDLQYMRATNNNPVGLYACAGLGNTGAKDAGINWPLVNVTTF